MLSNYKQVAMFSFHYVSVSIASLLKRSWNEIPEVVGSAAMAVVGEHRTLFLHLFYLLLMLTHHPV